jgi:hypothetical protein
MSMAGVRTAVLVSLAVQLLACATEHAWVRIDRAADGDLRYVPSSQRVENGASRKPQTLSSGSFAPFRTACQQAGTPCGRADIAYYARPSGLDIYFIPPTAIGVYALEDLDAVACEAPTATDGEEHCTRLSGSLDVSELAFPCGEDACGRFEGVLTIDSPSMVQGNVTLHYTEHAETYETGGGCEFRGQGG